MFTYLFEICISIIYIHARSENVEDAAEIDDEEWLLKAWTLKVKTTTWTRKTRDFWLVLTRSNDIRILYW